MLENKPITVVDGYWVPSQSEKPDNQRFTLDQNSLDTVCYQKAGYEMALEILEEDALDFIDLEDSNLKVLLSEKTRPYPPKSPLDLMLLVAAETPKRIVHNIADLKPSELTQVLKIAEATLEGLEKTHTRSSDSPLVHRVIAYNYNEDPLPEEKTKNLRKTYTQTLPVLHLHAFVLSKKDIEPTQKESELSQKERDIARDPLFSTIHILAQIPSIRELFAEKNISLVRGKDLQFQTKNGLSSKETAESLVHIHETFKKLYQQIAGLFVDFHQSDAIDMPLLDQETIFGNISSFMQKCENTLSE